MNINRIPLSKKEDARGWLVENESSIVRDSMRHFFVSYSKPGIIRGQHYHKRKTEWFLIIKGEATVYFKDVKTKESKSIEVNGNKPEIIEINPMIAHAIKNTGRDNLCLVAIVSEPLDQRDPDTFPHVLI